MFPNFELEAQLIQIDFQNMLVAWGADQPLRNGLHASSVLVSDEEWCVREHILHELFPNQAVKPEIQPWQWKQQDTFLQGWELHRKWQHLFRQYANVVSGQKFTESGFFPEPELDLTHYDATRNIYFSPDAILEFGGQRYVVEIKGIGHSFYETLTDDLNIACAVCETVQKARAQANLYMHLLELKKVILLIENKNNQEFKVWVIEYDQAASVKFVQRIYDVKGATTLTRTHGLVKLPARIPACQSKSDDRARKCPMRDVCFSKELKVEGEK